MREFWIFRKDGSSYIENANDIAEIYVPEDALVEENFGFKEIQPKKISTKEEKYYEKLFNDFCDDFVEFKKDVEQEKIDKLIENKNNLSAWDRRFVYGCKKNLKTKPTVSLRQKEILNDIYKKIFG